MGYKSLFDWSLLHLRATLGTTIGSGLIAGSWFFAKKPAWTINETVLSDWLNLKWFAIIAKAWISLHLLAVARAKYKAVLIVTWSLEALCRGSNGDFCKQVKTQDNSHLGVRYLCTGYCSLKDLINSDKTGLDPILLPVLILVLLNPDIPCFCKQCRSRSEGFWRSQLIWICTVCHCLWIYINNLDQVIWLAEN